MSNQENDQQPSSVTTTTEQNQQTDASLEALTPREEKIVRMVHGLSEDDSRSLEFGLGADEQARMKLALIEQQLAEVMAGNPAETPSGEDDRPSPAQLLSSWLDDE